MVVNHFNGNTDTSLRSLDGDSVFVRNSKALGIINKVRAFNEDTLNNRVSSQKPFDLRTYVVPTESGDIKLRYNKGVGPFNRKDVSSETEWIDK